MGRDLADDTGKLLLRLTLGVLILLHGVRKITDGVGPIESMLEGAGLPTVIAYGVYLGEVLGPLLLMVGWYARVGAGLIAINMLFAIGLVSWGGVLTLNDFGGWAVELEGIYLFTAVALVLMDPGRFSVNRR